MKKVLLIDAGYNDYELDEPLGIETLYACIANEFSYDVEIDMKFLLIDKNFKCLDIYDMVCLSANINSAGRVDSILNYYTLAPKKPLIVVGGVMPTLDCNCILHKYPEAICIIGEGEVAINALIRSCVNGRDKLELRSIPNIAYVNNNRIVFTKRQSLDLNTVTYMPYRKYCKDIIELNGLARMETSRGCDWNKCSFCIMPHKYGGSLRRCFPLKRVFTEIEFLSNIGAKGVYFTDEEFLSYDYKRLRDFIIGIKRLKDDGKIRRDFSFFASTSTRFVLSAVDKNHGILQDLKKIGFAGFFIGIESGSDSQLRRYKKGIKAEDNARVLKVLEKDELIADIGYILFDPLMSMQELKENISFIKNNLYNTTSRVLKVLRVIPNTKYCQQIPKNLLLEYNYEEGCYGYKFLDDKIESILNAINSFEEKRLSEAYEIQAKVRAGFKQEINSDICELISIRRDDIDELKSIVEYYDEKLATFGSNETK